MTTPQRFLYGCALGSCLFLLYLLTATFDQRQSVDSLSTLVPAWRLATDGTVYADQYEGFTPWLVEVDGHVISNRLPGAILWATPFYFVLGRGGEFVSIYPAAVASAAAATLAVAFLYLALSRVVRRSAALTAAAVLAVATPTWSVSADSLWTHGPAQLFLALSLLLYAADRYGAGGLAQAAAILTRPHLAVVPACMGVMEGVRRHSLRPVVVIAAASSLGVAALVLYYRLVYGQWTLSGGYGALGSYGVAPGLSPVSGRLDGSTPFWSNVAEALVSPGRGLFVYSPFLLLLLPGLRQAWVHAPTWARSAAVSGVAYAAVQLWNNGYSGEDFFGYRFLLEPLTLWTPLLTLAYVRWTSLHPRLARLFWGLVSVSFSWQAAAAVTPIDHPETLDLWRETGYAEVWREQQVTVVALVSFCVAVALAAWWLRTRDTVTGLRLLGATGRTADATERPNATAAPPNDAPPRPSAPHDSGR